MKAPPVERAAPRTMLLTADTLGGVWSHTLELARALGAFDIHIVLAAMGRTPSDGQRRAAGGIWNVTLHDAPYRLPWMERPWEDVERAGVWLLGLAQEYGCELVHLSEPVFAALPWRIPVLAVGHSCVLSWYDAVRGEAAPDNWSRYREAMTTGFREAGAVVAPSTAMLAELRRHYGVHHGSVVRNGRSAARYTASEKIPVVLTAGRLWDPAKNVAALIVAAPHLSWPVLAAGETIAPDGESPAEAGAVRLLGSLDEPAMARELSRAAIFALPARYEPFGQAILEAALSGCALVLGDIPSLREQWDGVAAFVAPDDPAALGAAIEELIRDEYRRRRLGLAARRRGLACSPERMARGYLDVYHRLRPEVAAGAAHAEGSACAS